MMERRVLHVEFCPRGGGLCSRSNLENATGRSSVPCLWDIDRTVLRRIQERKLRANGQKGIPLVQRRKLLDRPSVTSVAPSFDTSVPLDAASSWCTVLTA